MYIEHYVVTLSRNLCCRGNATLPSLFMVFGIDVAANNIKVFSAAMEMKQWVSFVLLSNYKIFRTAVHSSKY